MLNINKIYLFYSLIFFFPPVHELGHVTIATLLHQKIYEMHWLYITVEYTSFDYLHTIWEFSILIPAFCSFIYLYYYVVNEYKRLKNIGNQSLNTF